MNTKSIAEQLSLISTIIHRSKDCPEIPQQSDDCSLSPEIMQAAAVLEKIPVVQDTHVSAASTIVTDRP